MVDSTTEIKNILNSVPASVRPKIEQELREIKNKPFSIVITGNNIRTCEALADKLFSSSLYLKVIHSESSKEQYNNANVIIYVVDMSNDNYTDCIERFKQRVTENNSSLRQKCITVAVEEGSLPSDSDEKHAKTSKMPSGIYYSTKLVYLEEKEDLIEVNKKIISIVPNELAPKAFYMVRSTCSNFSLKSKAESNYSSVFNKIVLKHIETLPEQQQAKTRQLIGVSATKNLTGMAITAGVGLFKFFFGKKK